MARTFIVIDGPDGSGTTLHSKLLAERLQRESHDILLTAEPTAGPIGVWIRTQLRSDSPLPPDALQLLFTADRAWHLESVVKPALKEGKTVISDRYFHSTLAYGKAQNLSEEWLKNLNKNCELASKTIFLLPPLKVCLERLSRRKGTDIFERREMQEAVHAIYHELAAKDLSIVVIDSAASKEETAEQVYNAVHEVTMSA